LFYIYINLGTMKAIMIKSKNEVELKFLTDLLKKLGINANVLDIEDIEDIGLSLMMKKVDRSKKVDRETIMRKLRAK
jgi:7-cyano-7-deazaguanine synthase in queuosine biosynthesis